MEMQPERTEKRCETRVSVCQDVSQNRALVASKESTARTVRRSTAESSPIEKAPADPGGNRLAGPTELEGHCPTGPADPRELRLAGPADQREHRQT